MITTEFFRSIGLTNTKGIFPPIIEPCFWRKKKEEDGIFIKFMSDSGKRDAEQGHLFGKFLESKDIQYELVDPRKFIISKEDYNKWFSKRETKKELEFLERNIRWLKGSPPTRGGNFIQISLQERDEIITSLNHYRDILLEKEDEEDED